MACILPSRTVAVRPSTSRASPALYRGAVSSRDVTVRFRPSDGRRDLVQSAGVSRDKSKFKLPKNQKPDTKDGRKGEPRDRDFLTLSVTGEYDTAIFFLLFPALALIFLPFLSLALGGLHDKYPNIFGPFL